MAMPTLQEIFAKVTGLTEKVEALEADKATAVSALSTESQARVKLESELAILKAKASAPPPPEKKEQGDETDGSDDAPDIKECIANLEKAISEWHKAAAPGDDDESKAEDASDMEDDQACKAAISKNLLPKALAIRTKQVMRKQAFVANRGKATKAFDAKVSKAVIDQITALGIPMLTLRNTSEDDELRKQKPKNVGEAHSHAAALIARGFNSDPAVMALNRGLGRK